MDLDAERGDFVADIGGESLGHRGEQGRAVGSLSAPVDIGLVMGAPGVYAVGSMVRGLLIDMSPWDVPTLSAAALGLGLVAMSACYLPARRVLRIDPAPLLAHRERFPAWMDADDFQLGS